MGKTEPGTTTKAEPKARSAKLGVFGAIEAALRRAGLETPAKQDGGLTLGRAIEALSLHAIFIGSGFAALLYQVAWQRSLFAIFGVNLEAVTIVVTAFMLGLGIGGLVGGALSRSAKRPALLIFAVAETCIGLFALISLRLFAWLGNAVLESPDLVAYTASFVVVLIPTTLMGATLPLLVAHFVRRSSNVGRSVGSLYFVNTLGAALAAFAAVDYFLPEMGLSRTVSSAAIINIAIGVIVFGMYLRERMLLRQRVAA